MPGSHLSAGVSLVSYAHFGYSKDLKAPATYWSARSSEHAGLLDEMVVLDVADTHDIPRERFVVPIPGGKFLPRVFYLTERLSPIHVIDGRGATIELFDRLASRHVTTHTGVVHTFPSLDRTIQTAARGPADLAIYAPTAHPDYVTRVIKAETDRNFPNADPDTIHQDPSVYTLADRVLVLSEHARETFENEGISVDRIRNVGPIGVDTDHFRPPEERTDETFTVLSVANMKALKGTIYLLDAWERLVGDLPDARLVLVGTMSDTVERVLGEHIDRLPNVEHVGFAADPAPYYREASVLVHPSLTEGFGKVVAEAMATGLPVVITEAGPVEYVGENEAGRVVPLRDPGAIAEAIRYLYDHPDERHRMGAEGRRRAEANTWSDFSDRVCTVHRELLGVDSEEDVDS